jgi:hypothetical protein
MVKTEIEKIEEALDALLTQMIKCDRTTAKEAEGVPRHFEFICAADIKPIGRRQAQIERVIRNPVRNARKNAVYLLGERLFELTGDTRIMADICTRVAARRDRSNADYRSMLMDKTWEGIGRTKDSPGWCS